MSRFEIARRVTELGLGFARDYEGREPLLVAPLKSSVVFVADLSRARAARTGLHRACGLRGRGAVRLVKDLDTPIAGRHVLLIEDVGHRADAPLPLAHA